MGDKPLPDKLFFKIGEVADLVGVKPHVLRYWESEFVALRPMKTRGSHRVYSRRDVELAMLIRRLLHDEGFTIPGARKKLKQLDRHRTGSDPDPGSAREVALRAELLGLRQSLVALLEQLDRLSVAEPTTPQAVRVDRVTPAARAPAPASHSVTRTVPKLTR